MPEIPLNGASDPTHTTVIYRRRENRTVRGCNSTDVHSRVHTRMDLWRKRKGDGLSEETERLAGSKLRAIHLQYFSQADLNVDFLETVGGAQI